MERVAPLLVSMVCATGVIVLVAMVAAGSPGHVQQPSSPQAGSYSGISVASSAQLFDTMCALDAAGFGADEATLAEMPARVALRDDLLKMQGPATDALRQFYRDHALADPGDTLSRYITFALLAGPPPDFAFQVDQGLLPPDVLAIDGFQKVLADFYREAHLDLHWASVEPEYNREIERYQSPVRHIVTVTNGYLREILKPSNGRSFTVYVEPMVGDRTNFRNSGANYAIVVGAGPDIPEDDIRHAYLHFMLDPLPLRYRKLVESKNALLGVAAHAPNLPAQYRDDFVSLADECLIKAVELRIRRLPAAQLEAALAGNDRSGFILVRPFVTQLMKFEKAEPAMTYYFPDLISGIDVSAEQKRLQNFAFAPAEGNRALEPKPQVASANAPPTDLDILLAKGDREIASKDASSATATFQNILSKYPDEPRAMYGLAIASVLSGQADQAKVLFEQIVDPRRQSADSEKAAPADPSILSWSHVYLGRIHDLEDEREQAVGEYRAALSVNGAPEAARVAAQHGVVSAYRPPSAAPEKTPQ